MTRRQWLASAASGLILAPVAGLLHGSDGEMTTRPDAVFDVARTDDEWKQALTPLQYAVLRQHDTEFRGSSPLNAEKRHGMFHCAGCGQPLFLSDTKYDSGSGWPSFWASVENAVAFTEDRSHGIFRVEMHCRRCGGHLGHVFPDGPKPTGRRFCTNGAALTFKPAD
jgi:peptide-methionine (R)-S-oxide reductase